MNKLYITMLVIGMLILGGIPIFGETDLEGLEFWGIPFGSTVEECREKKLAFRWATYEKYTMFFEGGPIGLPFEHTGVAFNVEGKLHSGIFAAKYSSLEVNQMVREYLDVSNMLDKKYGKGEVTIIPLVNEVLLTDDVLTNLRSKYITIQKEWSDDRYIIQLNCGASPADLSAYNIKLLYRDNEFFVDKRPIDEDAL